MNKEDVTLKITDYSKCFNRSQNQVKFLLELLDYDFGEYEDLEFSIKKFHISYCPDDLWDCKLLAAKYRVFNFIEKL